MAKLAGCLSALLQWPRIEANDTAARLANVKGKVAKMEYVSTSEVWGDGINDNYDNSDNAICVCGHKNVMTKLPGAFQRRSRYELPYLKRSIVASDLSSQVQTVPAQVHFNNSDLPLDLHKDQKWKREVILMLILWAGNQEDAFNIAKQDIYRALQEIMLVIYPLLKNTASSILPSPPVVSQHLCDWRHGSASAAIVASFPNPQDPLPTNTAKLLLDHYHFTFLYEDLNMTVPEKAFHSIFVQQLLLSSHLTATKGYVQVLALDTSSLAKHGVVGALGLCAAAVMFTKSGDVKLKSPINVEDGIATVEMRPELGSPNEEVHWGHQKKIYCSASLAIGQEFDPKLLSDAGSDNEYALICMFSLPTGYMIN
ncbi:hypothetical protein BKA82DRAFT_4011403 [Pisolithus tinctorius]|nr:hypothetical protein BKA82DRAFT_4011403 [Pisolithus tinctorius]